METKWGPELNTPLRFPPEWREGFMVGALTALIVFLAVGAVILGR